jgi:hypothetical protein
MVKQALQRFDSGVSFAMSKLRQSGGGERDLGERRNSASASESPPISRAAISAARRCRRLIARWKRPRAVPWLVIVFCRWGYGFYIKRLAGPGLST